MTGLDSINITFLYVRQVALIEEAIRKGISDADSEARAAVRRFVGLLYASQLFDLVLHSLHLDVNLCLRFLLPKFNSLLKYFRDTRCFRV